jgi:hypothetical protein
MRQELHWQSQAQEVWEIDGKPYLIILPGRSDSARLYPTVATEDITAMKVLESFLTGRGAEVHYEIFDHAYSGEKADWLGHIVIICHRTVGDELFLHMEEKGCPYEFVRDPVHGLTLNHQKYNLQFSSPMDLETPEKRDYSLIVKCDRVDGNGKMFVFAGLHAMGTLGSAHYMSDPERLQLLYSQVKGGDFAALVHCEFEGPWRVKVVTDAIPPQPFGQTPKEQE